MAKLRRHITSRRARAISALLLLSAAIAVFSPCTSPSFYAASVSQNKAKLNELQQQINNYSDKIDSISSSVSGLLAEKERIDSEIELLSDKMAVTGNLISEYDSQISDANARIAEINADLDDKYDRFKSWLKMMQFCGDMNPVELAFSSDNFIDFLESADRLGTMVEYQNNVMDGLREDVRMIAEQTATLTSLKEEQVTVMESLRSDSERLESLRSQSENYIATLQADMTKYNQLRSEAQEQEDSLNAEIEAELKRLAEEERRRTEATAPVTKAPEIKPSNPSGGDETKPTTDTPTPSPDPGGAPSMIWPIGDRFLVSTTFRYQRPGESPHKGIDIPAPNGTAIKAAAAGTVVTAAKHSSYGNYVIVSHGSGYATLYAHCSKLYVSVGETVSQGETIAAVGNTGYSFGNHLHFEVRLNGALTDPLSYYDYMRDRITIQIYNG